MMEDLNFTTSLPNLMKNINKVTFSWYDYSLFGFMLILSVLIGIYFGCFGKKQSTAKEYLLGGKQMKVFPIAVSLIASHISGITLLGVPADVYSYGISYGMCSFSIIFVSLLTYYLYLPVFYKVQVTSTYEYLNMRFDNRIRTVSSFLFAVSILLYLPIVIYIPALAFSQATGINIHFITPLVCSICIFYTTIGGLKAVVWTDTIQFLATGIALLAVLILGIISAGGIKNIMKISLEGQRLDFDYDWSPFKRDTFWSVSIGLTIHWINHVGVNQGSIQKFIALPSLKAAKSSLIIFMIGMIIVKLISVFTGLIIYAKYFDCDPFSTRQVTRRDQLLPYYVLDVAGKIPGLPGLFMAGVFCAALSTLSASMNCVAATIYEDFVSPFIGKHISQKVVSNILKLIVVIVGVVSLSLIFLIEHLGGLLALSISFSGMTGGALLGLFTLGMLVPWANAKGALTGCIGSLILLFWMGIGNQYYQAKGLIKYTLKPTSIDGCLDNTNFTLINTILGAKKEDDEVLFLYRITYYYYTLIGASLLFLIALPVSWYTRHENPPINKDLLSPLVYRLLPENRTKYYSVNEALHIVAKNSFQDNGEIKLKNVQIENLKTCEA